MPRTIVITGCSSGFGRAAALHLARNGWRVWATVRRAEHQASLANEAGTLTGGGALETVLCDITRAEDVQRLAQTVSAATPALDALVNNAGTAFPAPLELLPLDDLRSQLETNVVAHLGVTQALLPLLKAARGTLVNVSSTGGRLVFPVNGAYHMSKFALEAMSDALRVELAPFGVRVVVLQPGSSPTAIWETSIARGRARAAAGSLGAYGPLVEAVEAAARTAASTGFPPEQFARVLQRVLDSRRPAPRYAIPAAAGLLLFLRQVLPDRLWDWSVRRALRW